MKTQTTHFLCSLALLLPVACGDSGSATAPSPDDTADIQSWETSTEDGQTVLRALDGRGALVAEMTLLSDATDAPVDSVTLSFSAPLSGEVIVSRDGSVTGDVDAQLLELAGAAHREFPTAEPVIPELSLDGSVQKATATGSFRVEGGLFGTSGQRTVGTLCPPGETRRAFRVEEVDEPLFGGSCDGEGFRTSNVSDCRIRVGFSVAALSAVRCEWEVTSR